jgi:predicted GIY-YIG superfamily endonuclease
MISITFKIIQETFSSVILNQVDKLPEVSAIYYVVVNERVLYVGQAADLKSRWQHHHRALQLTAFTYADIPVYVYWRECEKSALDVEEQRDIKDLNPPLNRSPILVVKTEKNKNQEEHKKSSLVQEDCTVFNLSEETVRKIKLGLEAGFTKREVFDRCVLEKTDFSKKIAPYKNKFATSVNRSIIATWYVSVEGLSKEEAIDKALNTETRGGPTSIISSPEF